MIRICPHCDCIVIEPGEVYCQDCQVELLARASSRGRDLDVDCAVVELE